MVYDLRGQEPINPTKLINTDIYYKNSWRLTNSKIKLLIKKSYKR